MSGTVTRASFWRKTQRITLALLAAWLLVTLSAPWFARDLHDFHVFGFPLGYWFAAEGALLLYLAIIIIYVVVMDRLEAQLQTADGIRAADDGSAR